MVEKVTGLLTTQSQSYSNRNIQAVSEMVLDNTLMIKNQLFTRIQTLGIGSRRW